MDKRIDPDYSDFEAGIIEELEVRLAEQKDLMDLAMIAWEESGRPFLMPEEVQSWWMRRPLFSPTLEKASNKNVEGFMEVKVDDVKLISGSKVTVIGIVGDGWFTVRDSHGGLGVCSEHDFDAEGNIKPQLSDLEIVQKALNKTDGKLGCSNSYSEVIDPFGKVLFDDCHESLLTWAKQTMSDSKDSTV